MKIRTIALAAAALAFPAGLVASSGASAAPLAKVTFTGSIKAVASGSVTISPPLTNSPSSGPLTFTTTATLTKPTGDTKQGGVTITKAKYSSVGTEPAGTTCDSLESNPVPEGMGTVKYTTTGGSAAPSTLKFKSGSLTNTNPITVSLTKGVTTGSFATPGKSKATLVIDQTIGTLLTECGSTGVSSLSFTGVNGKSTFVIGG